MSQTVKLRLEDLDIKPYMISKLKLAGIDSVFNLAISIPHQLIDVGGGRILIADDDADLTTTFKAIIEEEDYVTVFVDVLVAIDYYTTNFVAK